MPKHVIADFCRFTNAKIIRKGRQSFFTLASIDSRLVKKGDAFFALLGENTDGRLFIPDAVQRGATCIISADCPEINNLTANAHNCTFLQHHNPLQALQSYATWYRQQQTMPIIGVTGSFGKTSTKDFLGAVLKGRVYTSFGNLNNTIGLPLCLLGLSRGHDCAVFELGISKPGEMSLLAGILRPNIAIVNGVGCSHGEFFSSHATLALEKFSITKYMTTDSVLFLPFELYQQFDLSFYPGRLCFFSSSFSSQDSRDSRDIRNNKDNQDIRDNQDGHNNQDCWFLCKNDHDFFLRLFGHGPLQSLYRSLLVAKTLGLLRRNFRYRLRNFSLSPLRMEKYYLGRHCFVLDCYNACPESMRSFLKSMSLFTNCTLILGDMLELGENSFAEHRGILESASLLPVSSILVLGTLFSSCARELKLPFIQVMQDKLELKEWLKTQLLSDQVMVFGLKASRGLALETVVYDLQKEGF